MGYIVLLCDKQEHCHVLTYTSRKYRRFVRSIMTGEVYEFSHVFDAAVVLKHDMEFVYNQKIPLILPTDSKQMFHVITKARHTTERKLMIDIAAARESYTCGEISNLGLVLSEDNVADGLTKPGICETHHNLILFGTNELKVKQWIIRIGKGIERL